MWARNIRLVYWTVRYVVRVCERVLYYIIKVPIAEISMLLLVTLELPRSRNRVQFCYSKTTLNTHTHTQIETMWTQKQPITRDFLNLEAKETKPQNYRSFAIIFSVFGVGFFYALSLLPEKHLTILKLIGKP